MARHIGTASIPLNSTLKTGFPGCEHTAEHWFSGFDKMRKDLT